ncbi:MAG: hypothetical protein IKN74_03450 [Clostridia bacterium]|nr:hypothetical protein [Clostridia bacterium]
MRLNSEKNLKALDYYLKTKVLRMDFLKKQYGLALGTYGFSLDNLHQLDSEMQRESTERYADAVYGTPSRPKALIDDKINEITKNVMRNGSRRSNAIPFDSNKVSSLLRTYLISSYHCNSFDQLKNDYSQIYGNKKLSTQEVGAKAEELLDAFSTVDCVKGTFSSIVEMLSDYNSKLVIKKSCDAIARTLTEVNANPTLKSHVQDGPFANNLVKLRNELRSNYPLRFKRASKAYQDPTNMKRSRFVRKAQKAAQKLLPFIAVGILAFSGAAHAVNAIYQDIHNAGEIDRANFASAMNYTQDASYYDISPATIVDMTEISNLLDKYQTEIPSVEEFSSLLERMDSTTQLMIQEKITAAYNRLPQDPDSKVRLLRVETSTHSRELTDDGRPYTADNPYIAIVTTDEHGWDYDFAQKKYEVTPQVTNESLASTRLARSSSKEDSMKPGNNLFQSMQYYSDVNEEFRNLVASGADQYTLADFINGHIDTLNEAWDQTMNYSTIRLDLDKNFRILGIGDYYSLTSSNPVPEQTRDDNER